MHRSKVPRLSGSRTVRRVVPVLAVLAMCLTGCAELVDGNSAGAGKIDTRGDAATWQLMAAPEPTADGSKLYLGVTRLGCANGVTGEVLQPTVVVEEDRVLISTRVEHFSGGADCPGNDVVPLEIELGPDALNKDVIDAACLSEGEAAGTSPCSLGPARWHLPTVMGVEEVAEWTTPADYNFQVTSLCGERAFLGTFNIDVTDDEVTGVVSLDASSPDLATHDAMTVQDILQEARAGISDGRTVRLSLDDEGDPRYVSIGDNLAQSDGASCYFIHELSAASAGR